MECCSLLLERLSWLPPWLISLVLFVFATSVALFVHRMAFRAATLFVQDRDLFWRSLVSRNRRPTRLTAVVAAIAFVHPIAPLTPDQAAIVNRILLFGMVVLLAWTAHIALHVWTVVYLRRFKLDSSDNLHARKHVTQAHILQRVVTTLIIGVAIAACLMTFDGVRQYGISLLASAGAAGIIAGLALQPVLKNLFAGIQLAITQPIRIDDALLVEGEWGNVEEITATYVVIRVWDLRRLILPLSYFIERPFQNWTREEATLIGSVFLYLDYSVPIDAVRAKVEEIVKATPLWDKRVVNVQVTDFKEATMEVRILASAADSGRTFDLRCEIREKLISFLQAHYPTSLPKQRAELVTLGGRGRSFGREPGTTAAS
jgi:small-conductance mechanosensitive channel